MQSNYTSNQVDLSAKALAALRFLSKSQCWAGGCQVLCQTTRKICTTCTVLFQSETFFTVRAKLSSTTTTTITSVL
eukprot:5471153-Amphidinium_carterae.1